MTILKPWIFSLSYGPLQFLAVSKMRSLSCSMRIRPAIDTTGHGQTRLNAVRLRFELINVPISSNRTTLKESCLRARQPDEEVTWELN